jgi:nucleotide-binding universal stress UspA family protein
MKTILVPIDLSDATDSVIETACALALAFHAKIVLAHVVVMVANEIYPYVEDPESASNELSLLQADLENEGVDVETSLVFGPPAICILEEAERINADCIVIGSHGHGALYNALTGGAASQVLKNALRPVLIVPVARGKLGTGRLHLDKAHN